jgi:hypothetical protein
MNEWEKWMVMLEEPRLCQLETQDRGETLQIKEQVYFLQGKCHRVNGSNALCWRANTIVAS